MDKFFDFAHVPAPGFERRFAERFAIIYAALRLARRYRVITLKRSYIFSAVNDCYRAAVSARGLPVGAKDALRSIFELVSDEVRFVPREKGRTLDDETRRSLNGYLDEVNGEKCFLIRKRAFLQAIRAHAHEGQVLDQLEAEDLIEFRASRTSRYRESRVDGKKEPFVCLRNSQLPKLRQLAFGEMQSARTL